jgi:ADP-ribose pyrophosphatase YjhB (NUDIX family)
MTPWTPRLTVATVVLRGDRYLLVEERDKSTGAAVFNQPAGHLESGETLLQAASRETLEETRWLVELRGVLGIALYTAPANGITYCRTAFLAAPLREVVEAVLDPDIICTHWLEYEEILAESARMRSPLVLATIELHRQGICYPLNLIYSE